MTDIIRKYMNLLVEGTTKTSEYHSLEEWKAAARELGLKIGKGAKSGQPVCYDDDGKIHGKWESNDGKKSLIPNSGWERGYIKSTY